MINIITLSLNSKYQQSNNAFGLLHRAEGNDNKHHCWRVILIFSTDWLRLVIMSWREIFPLVTVIPYTTLLYYLLSTTIYCHILKCFVLFTSNLSIRCNERSLIYHLQIITEMFLSFSVSGPKLFDKTIRQTTERKVTTNGQRGI